MKATLKNVVFNWTSKGLGSMVLEGKLGEMPLEKDLRAHDLMQKHKAESTLRIT